MVPPFELCAVGGGGGAGGVGDVYTAYFAVPPELMDNLAARPVLACGASFDIKVSSTKVMCCAVHHTCVSVGDLGVS